MSSLDPLDQYGPYTYNETYAPQHHPAALSSMSRACAMAKHVTSKALKYAVFTAIGGAILFALLPGIFLGPVAALTSMFSHDVSAALMSKVATAAVAGAKFFGLGGALIGATIGILGASEAADEQEEERIAAYERSEMRQERMAALEQMRRKPYFAPYRQTYDSDLTMHAGLPAASGFSFSRANAR